MYANKNYQIKSNQNMFRNPLMVWKLSLLLCFKVYWFFDNTEYKIIIYQTLNCDIVIFVFMGLNS